MKFVRSALSAIAAILCATSAHALYVQNASVEEPISGYDWQQVAVDPNWVWRTSNTGMYPARLGGGLIGVTHGSYALCLQGLAPKRSNIADSAMFPTYTVLNFGSSSYAGGETLLVDVLYITSNDAYTPVPSTVTLNGVVFASLSGRTQKWRTYSVPTVPGPQQLTVRAEQMLTNWPEQWGAVDVRVCIDNVRIVNGTTF